MSNFITSKPNNPCQNCGGTDGDCRQFADNPDMILCMNAFSQNDAAPGWKFKKRGSNWGTLIVSQDGWDEDSIHQWKIDQQAKRERHLKEREEQLASSMPAAERDVYYRQILEQLRLHPDDRANLVDRGMDDDQIKRSQFVSVDQWQKLEAQLPHLLPGINITGLGLVTGAAGYLCPCIDVYGCITGFQVRRRRLEEGRKNRYYWLSSRTKNNPTGQQPTLPNSEHPLTVRHPIELHRRAIGLVEGIGPKPFLAAERLGIPFIGAAGGMFPGSPETLKESLEVLSQQMGTVEVVELYPDAGMLRNQSVMSKYEATLRLVESWGFNAQVCWWNQVEKGNDIDQISDFSQIRSISTEEFLAMAPQNEEGKKVLLKSAAKAAPQGSMVRLDPSLTSELSQDEEQKIPPKPKFDGFDVFDLIDKDEVEPSAEGVFIANLKKAIGYSQNECSTLGGHLHVWNGKYHEEMKDSELTAKIQIFLNKIYTPKFNKKADKWEFKRPFTSSRAADNCLTHLKNLTGKPIDGYDRAALSLADGIFRMNYKDGKPFPTLSPHSPDVVCLRYAPFSYKDAMKADTSHAKNLLSACSQPDRLIEHLSMALDLEAMKKKNGRPRAGLLLGSGANGKDALKKVCGMAIGGRMGGFTLNDFAAYDEGRRFNLSALPLYAISWGSENNHKLKLENQKSLMTAISCDESGLARERKGRDAEPFIPNCVLFFNLNYNLLTDGCQYSTKSRFAIYEFLYTFFDNKNAEAYDPNNPFHKLADPRFKYDEEWVSEQVVPGFFRLMVEAFCRVYETGFDFSFSDAAMHSWAEKSSHILQWASDVGLIKDADGQIGVKELYDSLQNWYVQNEYLKINTYNGDKRYNDPNGTYDKAITRERDLFARLSQYFGSITSENDKNGSITGARNRKYIKGLRLVSLDQVDQPGVEEPKPEPMSHEFVSPSQSPAAIKQAEQLTEDDERLAWIFWMP